MAIFNASTSQVNAAATITIPANPKSTILLWDVRATFGGGSATKALTIRKGSTVIETQYVTNTGPYVDNRSKPMVIPLGKSLEVSLAASGSTTITGCVGITYEIDSGYGI